MKKGVKIALGVCGCILVLGISLVAWQWENVKALSTAVRYSKEDIEVQIADQKLSIENTLKDYGLEGVIDFTHEEEEAIRRGYISFEEALEQLEVRRQEALGNSAFMDESPSDNVQTSGGSVSQTTGTGTTTLSSKEKIEQSVNQMYVLKAKYIGRLGEVERQGMSEYRALTEEQKQKGGLRTLANQYLDVGLSLEKTCDVEVEAVVSDLTSFLKERNESLEIISVMRAAYKREKELKKAYYMSLIQ